MRGWSELVEVEWGASRDCCGSRGAGGGPRLRRGDRPPLLLLLLLVLLSW
jgi:hypothetical protein